MWSKKHEKCINCGTTDTPHKSKGLCINCYHKKWRKDNPEKVKAAMDKYNASDKRKTWRKEYESTDKYKEYMLQKAREYRARNTELCYDRTRKWREENQDHLKAYNEAQKDVRLVKKYGDDALRLKIECGYVCQKCGSEERVAVHHKDWDDTNNVYENFAILYGSCHSKLHNWQPPEFRLQIFDNWMKS